MTDKRKYNEGDLPQDIDIVCNRSTARLLHETLENETAKLKSLISDYVFAMQDEPIEHVVFELLKSKGLTFASAESCTGGNIAHRITLVPGSSEVFRGTAVTYATPTKTKVLGVPAETIEQYSVVSQPVVEGMAKGVQELMEADFGWVHVVGKSQTDGGRDHLTNLSAGTDEGAVEGAKVVENEVAGLENASSHGEINEPTLTKSGVQVIRGLGVVATGKH